MTRPIAAAGVLTAVALAVAANVITAVNGRWRIDDTTLGVPVLVVFALVGAVIAWYRPGNAVGWLMVAGPLLLIFGAFADEYARYAVRSGSLPGAALLSALDVPAELGGLIALLFVPYVYPTGSTLGRRWSVVVAALAVLTASGVLGMLIARPTTFREVTLSNPLAIDALRLPAGIAMFAGVFAIIPLGIGALIAVFVRLRRSQGVERQQVKWFAYAAVLAITWIIPYGPLVMIALLSLGLPDPIAELIYPLPLIAIPLAMAVAILRYRLYDVDRLVNRTLVYGGASGVVLLVFVALTAAAQAAIQSLTGDRSDLAAMATAVVAGTTFQPMRARAQRVADRVLPPRTFSAMLFTDIVGSTDRIAELGDEAWRRLIDRYYTGVRTEISRAGGQEVSATGDGLFAIFGEPLPAVRCAVEIDQVVRGLGLRARTGVHAGEIDVSGAVPTGLNVHLAARVMSAAGDGGVLVSSDVRELLEHRGIVFSARGSYVLKGIPRPVELFALTS